MKRYQATDTEVAGGCADRSRPSANRRNLWMGVWRVADPKITLASVASMSLGAAAAAADGPMNGIWLAVTFFAIFSLEAAKNASGEIFDFDSGTDISIREADQSPFSGGKKVLVDGLMTKRQIVITAASFYALGCLMGILIVIFRERTVLWLGLVGVGVAFFYHSPPVKLSYRGFGELAVAMVYGPLIALGTYQVQRGVFSYCLLLVSMPLGLLIGSFLWINEFPDMEADASAGKKTLVVRLGKERASEVFALIIGIAFAWLVCLPLFGLPLTIWLGVIALPQGVRASVRLIQRASVTQEIISAQAWTLSTFVLFAVGCSIGFLL